MSPRIPAPPDPPRPHTLSIRLSDEEKDELEETLRLLAGHKMLHDELKQTTAKR